MPEDAIKIGICVTLGLSFFTILFGAYQFSVQIRRLRRLVGLCLQQALAYVGINIAMYFENGTSTVSWIFIFIWGCSLSLMFSLLFLTIIEPVYLMLGQTVQKAHQRLQYFEIHHLSLMLSFLVCAALASNPAYENIYAQSVLACAFCIELMVISPVILMLYFIETLIFEITKLIKSPIVANAQSGNSSSKVDRTSLSMTVMTMSNKKKAGTNKSDPGEGPSSSLISLQTHLRRLRILRVGVILFFFAGCGTVSVTVVSILVSGYVPYSYLLWYVGFTALHFVATIVPMIYAMRISKTYRSGGNMSPIKAPTLPEEHPAPFDKLTTEKKETAVEITSPQDQEKTSV